MKRFLLFAGLAGGLALPAGCDDGVDSSASMNEVVVAFPSAIDQNLCQTTGRVPSSTAGSALLWTIEALNLFPAYATDDGVRAAFDASVFDSAPASALAASLRDVGDGRPFALAGFTEVPGETAISAVLASSRSGYLQVVLETTAAGKITVLHFAPYQAPATAPDCPEVSAAAAPSPAPPTPAAGTPNAPVPTSQPSGQ